MNDVDRPEPWDGQGAPCLRLARVAICEDDEAFIQTVSAAIANSNDLQLHGIARNCAEGHHLLTQAPAQVLLVDLGLPDGSGIELIRAAQALWPDCITLVSTVFGDEAHVIQSLEAGAMGYLLKDQWGECLTDEIRIALAGGSPISPVIARQLLNRFRPALSPAPESAVKKDNAKATGLIPPRLSPREQQVLELITKGFSYEEIGQQMQVTRNTVLSFVRRIYAKLGVRTQIQAIDRARNHGLLDP
jgi:DNA-binding NarL/FixJ family response regulator